MKLVLSLAALLLIGLNKVGLVPPLLRRISAHWNHQVLFAVELKSPVVALTIDDGPDRSVTPEILAVLAEHDVTATFFMIGQQTRDYPDVAAAIVAGKHELGNHMFVDTPSHDLEEPQFRKQLVDTHEILAKTAGSAAVKYFRPASGQPKGWMFSAVKEHCYVTVLGSVYPFDAHIDSQNLITRFIRELVRPGSIIVLHAGADPSRTKTVAVLREILPELKRDFTVTTVSGLLAAYEKETKHPHPSVLALPAPCRRG